MSNYLNRARGRLNDDIDLFSDRGIDIAAGRRNKFGRKTERWYAEAEALQELKEEHGPKPRWNRETGHGLRRETIKIKKRVHFVADDEKMGNTLHKQQKENKSDKPDETARVSRKVRENDLDRKHPGLGKGKEVDRSHNVGGIMVDEELDKYEQNTKKLKERLAAIEGNTATLDGEPFPEKDMQAAADILILDDIKAASPVLKYPGPPKPPKIPLDSVLGLRGGGGERYEKQDRRDYDHNEEEDNGWGHDEDEDGRNEKSDNDEVDGENRQNDNAQGTEKDRQGKPRSSHNHHDRYKERRGHGHRYFSPHSRPKSYFAPRRSQRPFANTSNDNDPDTCPSTKEHDKSQAERFSPRFQPRNDAPKPYLGKFSPAPILAARFFIHHPNNYGSPPPIFVGHPCAYGKAPHSAFVDGRHISGERQSQGPKFFTYRTPRYPRQGPMFEYVPMKNSPGNGYFADDLFSDDGNDSEKQHRPTSRSHQKQSRNKKGSRGRFESSSPEPSRRSSETRANDNNARQKRNWRNSSQRSRIPSPKPSKRYSRKNGNHGRHESPVFDETDSYPSSSSSYESSNGYNNKDNDDDIPKEPPPDHYATLGINSKCTRQEFVPHFPIMIYYLQWLGSWMWQKRCESRCTLTSSRKRTCRRRRNRR